MSVLLAYLGSLARLSLKQMWMHQSTQMSSYKQRRPRPKEVAKELPSRLIH